MIGSSGVSSTLSNAVSVTVLITFLTAFMAMIWRVMRKLERLLSLPDKVDIVTTELIAIRSEQVTTNMALVKLESESHAWRRESEQWHHNHITNDHGGHYGTHS